MIKQEALIEPYIETVSGTKFYFLNPQQEQIKIKDIAWSLSLLNRFTGHTRRPYTVAEHSYNVAMLCPPHLALEGLLHDASEAYLNDIASPIKQFLPEYKEMEEKVLRAIYTKYMLGMPMSKAVHNADKAQLQHEAYYLMPSRGEDWPYKVEGQRGIEPQCWRQEVAYHNFLDLFDRLWKQHQFNIKKVS